LKNKLILEQKCEDCPIHHRAVCAKCEGEELAYLESIKIYRSFRSGEVMFRKGDELTHVASVVEGVAALKRRIDDGRTQLVGLLLPSDFIGHPGRTRVQFDVIAASPVRLCCFERDAFRKLVEDVPHISQRLIELSMDELDAARDWMVLLGRKTAEEKIATFIEMVVRRQHFVKPGEPRGQLVLPLSRGDIADYLGLTLETVSRQIARLKAEGIVEFIDKWHFRVKDLERLQRATGNDDDGGMIS
jgi:CRP/FNR family transcriptional regulator